MTQTLPQTAETATPRNGRHEHLNTIGDELRRIADILDRTYALNGTGRIAVSTLMIDIQIDGTGPVDDVQATVEILNEALHGVKPEYNRRIGYYQTPDKIIDGCWLAVYADMSKRAPSRIIAEAWDEAHAERDERRAAAILAEHAAADRLQDWFDSHKGCCTNGGYRMLIDDEHHMAIEWKAEQDAAALPVVEAVKAIDLGKPEITCGRCLIATGAHTFGIGCNARLAPVLLESGTPKHIRPELIHVVGPEDVAPGEPDDRGWDAPIKPTYVDELGASA